MLSDRLAAFAATLGFDLDPFQVEACTAIEEGRNVLVSAPTSSGKTIVGLFAVELASASGRRGFYTTPIKALSNQKYGELVARYGYEQVGLLTGDTSINPHARIVVMTTEVLRNMIYADPGALVDLESVVLDEVHYLGDAQRGSVWEEVIIHSPEHVTFTCLSATLSNADEFGTWLTELRGPTDVVVSNRRPVPLFQHVLVGDERPSLYDLLEDGHVNPALATVFAGVGPAQPRYRGPRDRRHTSDPAFRATDRPHRRRTASRPAALAALDRDGLLPVIIFIFSRAGCDAAVLQCERADLWLTTPEEQREIRQIAASRCAPIAREDLNALGYRAWVQSLARGVAAHHAGLLPVFKETVEHLFAAGLLKAVFATETLALGINMPARSVVLESLAKWDGTRHADITPGEYTQLTGRAGRRGIDVEGHAVVLGTALTDPAMLATLATRTSFRLVSSFVPTYNMAVNLIASVGSDRARTVLESSFAQFQADSVVVGLARQVRAHEATIESRSRDIECDLGDAGAYFALREEISRVEKADRRGDAPTRPDLRPGTVVGMPAGRRTAYGVVVEVDEGSGSFQAVDLDARLRTYRGGPVPTVLGQVKVDRHASVRKITTRRTLAARLREAVRSAPALPARRGPSDEVTDLRRRLRANPVHQCPERNKHARAYQDVAAATRERDRLLARIATRTNSIAVRFDRLRDVLTQFGYLDGDTVTAKGQMLRFLYNEDDLVLAECLTRGVFNGLGPAELAAVASAFVYDSRGDVHRPMVARLGDVLSQVNRIWIEVQTAELDAGLGERDGLDLGMSAGIHAWARGASIADVLDLADVAVGDFVRAARQVIDLLDQIAHLDPPPPAASVAARAVEAINRAIVQGT